MDGVVGCGRVGYGMRAMRRCDWVLRMGGRWWWWDGMGWDGMVVVVGWDGMGWDGASRFMVV